MSGNDLLTMLPRMAATRRATQRLRTVSDRSLAAIIDTPPLWSSLRRAMKRRWGTQATV